MKRKLLFLFTAILIVSYGVSAMAQEINVKEDKVSPEEISKRINKYNEEIMQLSEERKVYYQELDKVRLPIEEKIYNVDVKIGELRQKITQEKKKLYSVE